MVTYVGLLSFTDKGIQGIKDTTKRAVAAREVAKKFGVTIREMLWTETRMSAADPLSISHSLWCPFQCAPHAQTN